MLKLSANKQKQQSGITSRDSSAKNNYNLSSYQLQGSADKPRENQT